MTEADPPPGPVLSAAPGLSPAAGPDGRDGRSHPPRFAPVEQQPADASVDGHTEEHTDGHRSPLPEEADGHPHRNPADPSGQTLRRPLDAHGLSPITDQPPAYDLLRAGIDAVNSMIAIADVTRPDCPLIFLNAFFQEFTGYRAAEVLGQNCRFLQNRPDGTRDEGQPDLEKLRDAVRKGEYVRAVLRNYKKDGTLFWNELYLSPVADDARRVTHYIGVQNDVTKWVETVERLQCSEDSLQLFRQAFENASDALVITEAELNNPGPRIVHVNRAFTEMSGYTAEEAIGQTPRILQGPKTDRAMLERLKNSLRDTGRFRGETVNYRKDGSEYTVEWTIGPIRDESGRVHHWVASIRDVSDRRRLERQVLEAQSAERRRIAQDLHDGLSQQLAALSYFCQTLRNQCADRPDLLESVDGIAELARDAAGSSRTLAHALMPFDLSGRGLADALAKLARQSEEIYKVPCVFRGEAVELTPERAAHLFHITQEAVGNAVRHGRPGRVEITLEAADGRGVLTVADDGAGIDPDKLRETDGQLGGIGLHSMRYRAALIDGDFALAPRDGGGTQLRVSFPVTR